MLVTGFVVDVIVATAAAATESPGLTLHDVIARSLPPRCQ